MSDTTIDAAIGLNHGTFGIGTFSNGGVPFTAVVKSDGSVISVADRFRDTL